MFFHWAVVVIEAEHADSAAVKYIRQKIEMKKEKYRDRKARTAKSHERVFGGFQPLLFLT